VDESLLIALRLSKSGYGKPTEILKMPSDIVIVALEYEDFVNKYESKFIDLNRES